MLDVGFPIEVGRKRSQRAKALLGFPQRGLCPLALRDVAPDALIAPEAPVLVENGDAA
ncbi:hypothetical protein D3C83_101410 [compost metagenome]